jgi:uncharacterized membrane protein YhiD involved in acid resistance
MNTFSDIFKKGFLESTGNLTLEGFAMSMLVALICGLIIFLVYRYFFQGVVYNNNFNILLVLTCLVTTFVVIVISSNIVLSLGMVGALSIVRFRSAVKEPLDTGFIFWAVACGITAGAGLYWISIFAVVFVSIVFILLSRVRGNKHTYLLIVRYEEKAAADVLRILGRIKKVLKNKTSANGKTEMTYEVKIKADNTAFVEEMTAIDGVESATIVEFTGDYSA